MNISIAPEVTENAAMKFKSQLDSLVTEAHNNGLPDDKIFAVLEAEKRVLESRGRS